ncbi:unnamed protein product [Linum trigynum]|uniref:Uncharacterized protein n=1 Tax=Linum trigynum TaxID=586398 RepID=A0AAV2EVV7_9ROSI
MMNADKWESDERRKVGGILLLSREREEGSLCFLDGNEEEGGGEEALESPLLQEPKVHFIENWLGEQVCYSVGCGFGLDRSDLVRAEFGLT